MQDVSSQKVPHFLLVGNGSYRNRGCEAIVRGTMEILRECISLDLGAEAGSYGDAEDLRLQSEREEDLAIQNFHLTPTAPRWSRGWWEMQANKRLGLSFPAQNATLTGRIGRSVAALEIGGDNYSLDYGIPRHLLSMDEFLLSRGLPVIIWGASIGPFDREPEFKREMLSHLRKLQAVFVRESETFNYLVDNGVTENVYLVADPAFMMKPIEPAPAKLGTAIPSGCIGLNFSPLVGKSFMKASKEVWELTEDDLKPWFEFCVACVLELSSATQRPILLVPHVGSSLPGINDFAFLSRVQSAASLAARLPILCLADTLNAAETKWVISRCSVFAGARTHATIAGFSTHVPTLSFGYSVKAKGINQDIYGNLDYCLDVNEVTIPKITGAIRDMLEREHYLRSFLAERLPAVTSAALSAGRILASLLDTPKTVYL